MCEAAQGFLPEAYYWYVEGKNPRRTNHIGKRAIWKLKLNVLSSINLDHITGNVSGLVGG